MLSLRSPLATLFFGTAILAASQILACGSDDKAAPPPVVPSVPDAAAPTTPPTTPPTTQTTISGTRTTIYFGHIARLDGAAIAPDAVTDIVWELVFVPSESKLTTASLVEATTATPTFTPDALGGYTLRVTGKKEGQTTSVMVHVEAVDAPVFWRSASYVPSGSKATLTASTFAAGVYGALAPKELACAQQTYESPDSDSSNEMNIPTAVARGGASGGDVWEGPAGTASRVAYSDLDLREAAASAEGDAGLAAPKSRLVVATTDNTCASGDAKVLDTVDTLSALPDVASATIQGLRFSPDGSRVAYLRPGAAGLRLTTIGIDGASKRDLAPVLQPDDGTPAILPLFERQPRWKDASHVTWVRFVGTSAKTVQNEWELYSVEDRDGAIPELQMRCSAFGVSMYDFLADGTLLASIVDRRPEPPPDTLADPNEQVMNLAVLRANAATKECEVARALTQHTVPGSMARDLALSPDKSKVAFFSSSKPGPYNLTLHVGATDGSGTGPVPGVTPGTAEPFTGPRWVAGGAALTWGKSSLGGGPIALGTVAAIPATGGVERELTSGSFTMRAPVGNEPGPEQDRIVIVSGIGQGCGVSHGPLSSGDLALGASVGIAALVMRRRRRA